MDLISQNASYCEIYQRFQQHWEWSSTIQYYWLRIITLINLFSIGIPPSTKKLKHISTIIHSKEFIPNSITLYTDTMSWQRLYRRVYAVEAIRLPSKQKKRRGKADTREEELLFPNFIAATARVGSGLLSVIYKIAICIQQCLDIIACCSCSILEKDKRLNNYVKL